MTSLISALTGRDYLTVRVLDIGQIWAACLLLAGPDPAKGVDSRPSVDGCVWAGIHRCKRCGWTTQRRDSPIGAVRPELRFGM